MIAVILAEDLQIDGRSQLLQMGGIQVDSNGLVLVKQRLFHPTLCAIGGIELQVAHSLLGDGA